MGRGGYLAPWDALPYFQPITETLYTYPGSGQPIQIALPDPNRIELIFALNDNAPVSLSTGTQPNQTQGFILTAVGQSVRLQHFYEGPLVQAGWYMMGSPSVSSTLTVWEIKLAKWPKG